MIPTLVHALYIPAAMIGGAWLIGRVAVAIERAERRAQARIQRRDRTEVSP